MNCDKDVFNDLMELYPETAENIKIRSLEKREVIMYYLQKVRHLQLKRLNQEISKLDKKRFSKWLSKSTYAMDGESDDDDLHISIPHEKKKLSPMQFLE